jgi:hypothetical protein
MVQKLARMRSSVSAQSDEFGDGEEEYDLGDDGDSPFSRRIDWKQTQEKSTVAGGNPDKIQNYRQLTDRAILGLTSGINQEHSRVSQ